MSAPKAWYQWGSNPEDGYWIDSPQSSQFQPQIQNAPFHGQSNSFQNQNQQNAGNAQNVNRPVENLVPPNLVYQFSFQGLTQEEAQRRLDATRGIGHSHLNLTNRPHRENATPIAPQPSQVRTAGQSSNTNDFVPRQPQLFLPQVSAQNGTTTLQQPSSIAADPANNNNIKSSQPQAVQKLQPKDILDMMAAGAFGKGKYDKNYIPPRWQPLTRSDAFPQPSITPNHSGVTIAANGASYAQENIALGESHNLGTGGRPQKHTSRSPPDISRKRRKIGGDMTQGMPSQSVPYSGLGMQGPAAGMGGSSYDSNNQNPAAGHATGIYAPGSIPGTNAPQPKVYTPDLSDPDEGAEDIELDAVQCFFCFEMFHSHIMRRHIGQEHSVNGGPPDCPDCGKSFKTYALIKHYERMHTVSGEMREWVCPYPPCEKPFKTRAEKDRHFKETHLKKGPRFRCGILYPEPCGGAFKSMEELRDHFAATHPRNQFKRLGYSME